MVSQHGVVRDPWIFKAAALPEALQKPANGLISVRIPEKPPTKLLWPVIEDGADP